MSINELQIGFYQGLSKSLFLLKNGDNKAVFTFFIAAFLYGIFHAAGPGHGKAVISSYLLATGDTLKRGLALTWISSLAQGLVALIFTGVTVFALRLSTRDMAQALSILDKIFAVILILMGIRVIIRAFNPQKFHDCAHVPPAEQLAVKRSLKDDLALIFSIAIRPCTGAVFILAFALSQGLILYGVMAVLVMAIGTAITVSFLAVIAVYMKQMAVRFAANGSSFGAMLFKAIEGLAGLFLILFGIVIITGYFKIDVMGGFR